MYNASDNMTRKAKIMRYRNLTGLALAGALALTTACSPTKTSTTGPPIAHLEKRGAATQLIVDGKPFLALAGELTNPTFALGGFRGS